jgi:hypothetical protein
MAHFGPGAGRSALVNPFSTFGKSDTMWAMSTGLKRAFLLLVIYGILYLLVFPLPEIGANCLGKAAVDHFIVITPALFGLLLLGASLVFVLGNQAFVSAHDVLNKLCVRLC